MGGANDWRIPQNFGDHMRDTEKRLLHEERRPQIREASDLLGPGAGPYTVLTQDWNAPECIFNGLFHSEIGAQNSPDIAKAWIGQTIGRAEGYGVQKVYDYESTLPFPPMWVRTFAPSGGSPVFGAWTTEGFTQTGTDTVNIVSVNVTVTQAVVFPIPYPVGVVPRVLAVPTTPVGTAGRYVNAISASNTGFFASGNNTSTSSDIPFTWSATG